MGDEQTEKLEVVIVIIVVRIFQDEEEQLEKTSQQTYPKRFRQLA